MKTLALMGGLMALFLAVGQMVGGSHGMVMALVLGSAMNFIMYFLAAALAQVKPLFAMGGGMTKWFATHPPTEERGAALMRLAVR
jgi:Zn-dependent protease with chaperone function